MENLGAKMLTLPTAEVFMALQSGMLNSISTPPTAVDAYNWGAYLKHALIPPYSFTDGHIFANKQWFESLPIELQKTLLKVGNEMSIEATNRVMADSEATLAKYQAAGMTLHHLTGNQVNELRRITEEKVIPRLRGHITPEILQSLKLYRQKKLPIISKGKVTHDR
jgi:TRAP-type C4-dicarboxylate transport system substrate-binding protein